MKVWITGESQQVARDILEASWRLEVKEAKVSVAKTGFMVSTQEARDTLREIKDDDDPEVWEWAKDLGVCVRWMGGTKILSWRKE